MLLTFLFNFANFFHTSFALSNKLSPINSKVSFVKDEATHDITFINNSGKWIHQKFQKKKNDDEVLISYSSSDGTRKTKRVTQKEDYTTTIIEYIWDSKGNKWNASDKTTVYDGPNYVNRTFFKLKGNKFQQIKHEKETRNPRTLFESFDNEKIIKTFYHDDGEKSRKITNFTHGDQKGMFIETNYTREDPYREKYTRTITRSESKDNGPKIMISRIVWKVQNSKWFTPSSVSFQKFNGSEWIEERTASIRKEERFYHVELSDLGKEKTKKIQDSYIVEEPKSALDEFEEILSQIQDAPLNEQYSAPE